MNKGNVNIPFSWEAEPGISKRKLVKNDGVRSKTETLKLPPPPCQNTRRVSLQEIMIPLPPCPFQPTPTRSVSKKEHDPFMAAYRECTKIGSAGPAYYKSEDNSSGLRKKKSVFSISCKRSNSCSVVDGNMVRISHSE